MILDNITAFVLCDDASKIYIDDELVGITSDYKEHWRGPVSLDAQRIGIRCVNTGGPGAIIASLSNGLVTNAHDWKCDGNVTDNWTIENATSTTTATPLELQSNKPVLENDTEWRWEYLEDFSTEAYFIWPYQRPKSRGGQVQQVVYCEVSLEKFRMIETGEQRLFMVKYTAGSDSASVVRYLWYS